MIRKFTSTFPLRASVAISLGLLALVIVSLCCVLFYASAQNRESIATQRKIAEDYRAAMALDEAIDDLLYYSAELANSLSDESYDAFMSASANADAYISKISNQPFKAFLTEKKHHIEESALGALDAYVDDDRALGASVMESMRLTAGQLEAALDAYVSEIGEVRQSEEEYIVAQSEKFERVVSFFALFALLMLTAISALVWFRLFVPIGNLIKRLSLAASDTQNAAKYRVKNLPYGEIGDAGRALNQLLTSVEDALQQAVLRAEESENVKKRWQALFRESPDAIVMLEPETTRILEKNPATDGLLCLSEVDAGRDLKATDVHPHELEELAVFFNNVLVKGRARSDLLSCAIGDRRIPVSVVGVTVPHNDDEAILLHIRDMSAQKEHEEELELARRNAERANEAKTSFLANMSHEIRTPMNGVLGMTEALRDTDLSEDQNELVSIILASGKSLITVINDVLDYSKLESGKLRLTPTRFDIGATTNQVVHLLSAQAKAKGIHLFADIEEGLPSRFISDEGRIRQVLINLVGNAVKFTKEGEVRVRIGSVSDKGDHVTIRAEISDTGIGVAEDDLGRIFEKFEQVDGSQTRNFDGTGLGLSISKQIIDLLGGQIGVDSEIGKGSTFWFELKLPMDIAKESTSNFDVNAAAAETVIKSSNACVAPAEKAATNQQFIASTHNCRLSDSSGGSPNNNKPVILVAEDNVVNQLVIKTMIDRNQYEVCFAADGQEAVEKYQELRPALVIMDLSMPVMNGFEATKAIRALERKNEWPSTPIAAATAHVLPEHQKSCIDSGMDDFISKPINKQSISNLLNKWIKGLDSEIAVA